MREELLFSIIVPVYCAEDYLDQCVRSLRYQTYKNIEIILVDDGSPDRCPEMCDAYAQQDERIRVIHKGNGGPGDARNAGLKAARGEYAVFVDSDDYIMQDTCERLVPIAQSGCDIIACDGIAEGGSKRLRHGNVAPGQIVGGTEYLKLASRRDAMPMAACLYIYRRAFLEENGLHFKKGILHEDEQFIPRTFLAARQVTESGDCSYRYVIRENSIMTRKDQRKNAEDMYGICVELREIYGKLEDPELKELLIDSLVTKYLSLFQRGKLYRYGRAYLHKEFVRDNALRKKTKCKARLFCISPRLYWWVNRFTKYALCKIKRR